jgi:hypothetical protein
MARSAAGRDRCSRLWVLRHRGVHIHDRSQDHQEASDNRVLQDWLRPHVSAPKVAAETEYQGSGAQREPGCNVHAGP